MLFCELLDKGEYCARDINRAAEYFKKGSAVGDSFSMSWPDRCYQDGIGAELDLKQVFNSCNDAVKASNMNASSTFRVLC